MRLSFWFSFRLPLFLLCLAECILVARSHHGLHGQQLNTGNPESRLWSNGSGVWFLFGVLDDSCSVGHEEARIQHTSPVLMTFSPYHRTLVVQHSNGNNLWSNGRGAWIFFWSLCFGVLPTGVMRLVSLFHMFLRFMYFLSTTILLFSSIEDFF